MTAHSDGRYFQLQSLALPSSPRFFDPRTPTMIAEKFGVTARVVNLITDEVVATITEGVVE